MAAPQRRLHTLAAHISMGLTLSPFSSTAGRNRRAQRTATAARCAGPRADSDSSESDEELDEEAEMEAMANAALGITPELGSSLVIPYVVGLAKAKQVRKTPRWPRS